MRPFIVHIQQDAYNKDDISFHPRNKEIFSEWQQLRLSLSGEKFMDFSHTDYVSYIHPHKTFSSVRYGLLGSHVIDSLFPVRRSGNVAFRAVRTWKVKWSEASCCLKTFSGSFLRLVENQTTLICRYKFFSQWDVLQERERSYTPAIQEPTPPRVVNLLSSFDSCDDQRAQ